jgi:anti-sigma regulatory factor (Ser/Thr protein kinase)
MAAQSWTFEAAREAPGRARDAVRRFAAVHGLDGDLVSAAALCVSEAVTNAVVHAYKWRPEPGPVHLRAVRERDGLTLVVRDDGDGLTPRPDSPGLGIGLPLISQLSQGLELRTADSGGTEVVMRFALATA